MWEWWRVVFGVLGIIYSIYDIIFIKKHTNTCTLQENIVPLSPIKTFI